MDEYQISHQWRLRAACRGHDPMDFVPPFGVGKGAGGFTMSTRNRVRRAKAVCKDCTVTKECVAFANATETREGVWGGSYRARRNSLSSRMRQRGGEPGQGFATVDDSLFAQLLAGIRE